MADAPECKNSRAWHLLCQGYNARDALIRQARSNYESIFPTETPQERNRQRIDLIRKRDNFKFRLGEGVRDLSDDLMMDHADNGMPSDSPYFAPDSDPA